MPARSANSADDSLLDKSLEELLNIVTVRKREENVLDVPAAVTHFSEQTLDDYNIRSFADYATKTPNLSFAYGNGATAGDAATAISNARTIAIRGVAGAHTTGFYIDDTPLPGAVVVRLVDLLGIEVLKGPQGTLYGESSLGGNVRLISNAPDLTQNNLRYMLNVGQSKDSGNSLNSGGEAIGNVVVSPGVLALRIAGFWDDSAGYMSRNYLSDINDPTSPRISADNQGAQRNFGGSLTALMRLAQDVDLSFRVIHQDLHDNGFPAGYAPLRSAVRVRDSL